MGQTYREEQGRESRPLCGLGKGDSFRFGGGVEDHISGKSDTRVVP